MTVPAAKSKSSLFLIEMIVVILVFALASAVCASLFVQARLTSRRSSQLTLAVTRCQNAVEHLRAAGDDPDAMAQVLGASPVGDGLFQVGYDADGQPVQPDQARYLLTIATVRTPEDGLLHATVTMTETADPGGEPPPAIYSLKTTQYQPR